MTRCALVLLALAVGGLGCRSLIGYEELTVGDQTADEQDTDAGDFAGRDGGGGSRDTGTGTAVDSGRNGAAIDAAAPSTNTDTCARDFRGPECGRCCKETYSQAWPELERALRDTQCICGASSCTSECSGSVCGNGSGSMPSQECARCIDERLMPTPTTGACGSAFEACSASSTCRPVTECLNDCR